MSLSADRLRLMQEIYGESLSFSISKALPETTIGQCIVSYKKFVDYIIQKHGIASFHAKSSVDVCIITKPVYHGKEVYGMQVSCSSIMDAVRVAKLALGRSSSDFMSVSIEILGMINPIQVIGYAVEARRPKYNDCKIIRIEDVLKAKNHDV